MKLLLGLLLFVPVVFVGSSFKPQPGAPIIHSPRVLLPPMGFNFWTFFEFNGTNQTDQMTRDIAAGMVNYGLNTAGYQYVGLDAFWQQGRDPNTRKFVPNAAFPDMPGLIAYVHGLGLKFGIYESAWPLGCGSEVGAYGYEGIDAAQFAAWGVDLLKLDTSCNSGVAPSGVPGDEVMTVAAATQRMSRAIAASGRNILLTTGCGGGCSSQGTGFHVGVEYNSFYANGGKTVRIGPDMAPNTWARLLNAFTNSAGIAQLGGPDHWLDQDAMLTGEGVTDTEGQTSISLWAIQAAPLLFGADVRVASAPSVATIASLTNSDVIAVDQDALGISGVQVSSLTCGGATCQVWAKPLTGTHTCSIALFNLDSASHSITATFSVVAAVFPVCGSGPYATTRDLWAHSSLGTLTTNYTATVPSHGVAMIKIAP